jgi:hypothetical protein
LSLLLRRLLGRRAGLAEFRDDGLHRWGAALSAYNGGLGNVRKDRQLVYTERSERAALRGGPPCDPAVSRWFCFTLSEDEVCVEHHSIAAQQPSAKTASIPAASCSFSGPATRQQAGKP